MKKYFHRFNTQQEQNDFVTLADGQTITSNDSYYEPYVGINKENKRNVGFNKEYSIKLTNENNGDSWKFYKLSERLPDYYINDTGGTVYYNTISTKVNQIKPTKVEVGRCVKEFGRISTGSTIQALIFHYGLERIGNYSGDALSSWAISKVTLPTSLNFIENRSFSYTSNLKDIHIPFNATSNYPSEYTPIFRDGGLSSVTVDTINQYLYSDGKVLFKKDSNNRITGINFTTSTKDYSFPENTNHILNYVGNYSGYPKGVIKLPKNLDSSIGAFNFNDNCTCVILTREKGTQPCHSAAFCPNRSMASATFPIFVPDFLYDLYVQSWCLDYVNRNRLHKMSEFETFKNNGYEFPEQNGE